MSAMLSSGPTGAERMPSRPHKVLHDPGREPLQNHGHAKKLPTTLPQAIVHSAGPLNISTAPPDVWHRVALAKDKPLSPNAAYVRPRYS